MRITPSRTFRRFRAGRAGSGAPRLSVLGISMRQDWLAAFAFISIIALATASASAQMNGPMSSGQKAAAPAQAAPEKPAAVDAKGQMDVRKLFAGTCGWCHSDGGRAPGKGPQLMGTTLT